MDSIPINKKFDNDGFDRISSMPDPILGKILSYLPTKNAVGTRALSTRWKSVFPFGIPPIDADFDDSLLLVPIGNESKSSNSFVDFVDKFLNEILCNGLCLDRFFLKCEGDYGDAKILSWVRAALELKVREIVLEIFLEDPQALFCCLNGCETLVRLEVGKRFDLRIPENFSLPNLKRLQLNYLVFLEEDTDSINEFLIGCPLLENLWLESCDLQILSLLSIQSPVLKSLVIENSWTNTFCELVLDAPSLEVLLYCDSVALGYTVSNFKSLLAAHIDVGPTQGQLDEIDENSDDEALWDYGEGVAKLVTACSSTGKLYLASCSLGALLRIEVQLPEFQNLTWLALGCIPGNQWEILARLLLAAPNLKELTLEEGFQEYGGGYEKFESSLANPPICLKLHLKMVEFWVFNGEEDEFKFVEYLLKNGVLQKLKIPNLFHMDVSIVGRLIALVLYSKTCRIVL